MKLRQIGSNQTEVIIGNKTVLFSYETPVAAFINGQGFIQTEKKWSVTTSRHINKWLQSNNAEIIDIVSQETLDELVK